MLMRLTLSVIKAHVGSVGGHPSARMMATVMGGAAKAIDNGLLIDSFVCHTGDDIAVVMRHTRGEGNSEVHQFAWKTFLAATSVAKTSGLYGAGQDLLVDAPSGNIRGAAPAVAEFSFDHSLSGSRLAESFMVFAADKCGPGAYNLPLYLALADPMYCAGLMLPPMIKGFRFHVIDMDNTTGDSVIELDAPADSYQIASLLRDNERFGIDRIVSRTYNEVVVAVSAQRLHSIAGKYTGKDDPVAIVRNQGISPAPEEIVSPFAKAHFVGGDARGFARDAANARAA
jgi:fructose 1,6-bisphosphate aldolase/phosphatase